MTHYCVRAQKKDKDELAFYAWCEANSPEEARQKVRSDSILIDSFYDKVEPMENWKVEDIDIDKQLSLF